MKKAIAWILSLALALSAAGVFAETAEPDFETLSGLAWTFCSGVGAWSTDLRIRADGSFTGDFHDSDMGDTGDGYPDGTVYYCSFTGRMSMAGKADDYSWKIRVDELSWDKDLPEETIDDGVRYIAMDPYGLSEGDEMLLYRPGTPVALLSEDMQMWAHLWDGEAVPTELANWFLMSVQNDSGFVGEEPAAWMPNPWEDLTAEELKKASGLSFGVPEGAENVIYRYLRSDNLAEMQFTLDEDEYCARIQPAVLEEGVLMDISGMYFSWENEEDIIIGGCPGTIGMVQTGSEDWTERCLWYDAAAGNMYSLAVYTTDPDGLDLTAPAEQIYLPAQGTAEP